MKNFQLFVYGSLRSGFKSPAYEYISKYFTLVDAAKVKGQLYDMGDYPVAIPTTEEHFLIGELYVIKNENEFSFAIGQLDDYEGLVTEEGETPSFKRERTEVYVDNGTTTIAWTYWYNKEVNNKLAIESGDVLQYLRTKK